MRHALAAILVIHSVLLQAPGVLALKRFEAIRVDPDELRRLPESMRSLFIDPVPDGEAASNLEEAAKRAGFTPLLLSGKTPKRLFVTNAVNEEAKIDVSDLTSAL